MSISSKLILKVLEDVDRRRVVAEEDGDVDLIRRDETQLDARQIVGTELRERIADCLQGVVAQRLVNKVGGGRVAACEVLAGVEQSERDGADALLIELDTPCGLVTATKDIIQAILNSKVPVIVYVAPRGAWAASAGMYITVSAHVASVTSSAG